VTVVTAGQAIGVIEGPGSSTPVRSPFGGFLVGMLARRGERVREGQPVAWLRLA
jgi:biotin carboxyl carrier protein